MFTYIVGIKSVTELEKEKIFNDEKVLLDS